MRSELSANTVGKTDDHDQRIGEEARGDASARAQSAPDGESPKLRSSGFARCEGAPEQSEAGLELGSANLPECAKQPSAFAAVVRRALILS